MTAEQHSLLGTLTSAQVAQYYQQGYLVVPNLVDAATVQFAVQAIDDFITANPDQVLYEAEATTNQSPADLTPAERILAARGFKYQVGQDERFTRLASHAPVVSALVSLLGEHIKVFQDMALIKPPHIGSEKPHHQDCSYFEIEPFDQIVGTWWALDRARPENGCMVVWPQSHRLPLVEFAAIPGTPHHVIKPEQIDKDRGLPLPMEPGDVLFFSSRLFHYTPPNRSASRRRALQIHYASACCRALPGRTARTCYLVRGASQPHGI